MGICSKLNYCLKKYASCMSIDLKEAYNYRFNTMIWILVDVTLPFIMIFIWLAVFSETKEIQNYDVNNMVSYYLFANFCFITTTPNMEWFIVDNIKNGRLSSELLKPVDFFWRCIWGETTGTLVKALIYIPFFILLIGIYHNYVSCNGLSFLSVLLFFASLAVSYFVNCALKMILATLAFWLVDCWGIFVSYRFLIQILSGALIPIVLLPSSIRSISNILPFKMLISFPVSFILGKISFSEYFNIISVELIWMAGLLIFARMFWAKGLHNYEAVGG